MTDNTINNDVTMSGAGGTLLAGRYRVVRPLGQGGMGSVWLAEDMKLDGHPVAVKMLPSILVSNKRAYNQIKQEALLSLKLTHPNIAAVRAFEEERGNPFLVMDYIDGQTLDDYLAEKGTLAEDEAVKLLKPVAAALDYAHTQGVVHRDVKPGNVMIRKDGVPFVLDFGIAREIQETMTRVTGKLSSGTLMYMSPEQLNGDAPKPAQDVYSFAAMAYECLKGEPPFSRGQIEFQILNNPPAPLDGAISIAGGVTAGLAKSPEARPTTCAGVLATESRTIGSRVPRDRVTPATPANKPRTMPVILGALAFAALVGIGGWWLGQTSRGSDERQLQNFDNADARDARPYQEPVKPVESRVSRDRLGMPKGEKAGEERPITLPGGVKMKMVWCPPGSFTMGSPTSEEGRGSDEKQHRVTLTEGFWMGKFEVTQREWESVMGNNPSRFKSPDRPVENVSWEDCQKFVRKVNAAGDIRVALPTEAQWEYACRAGTTTLYNFGSSLNGDKANCDGNYPCGTTVKGPYLEKTASVGSYAPNAWGLYDMHGNVWEWCADWNGDYPTGSVTDPTGPASGSTRVRRGGSWFNFAIYCRSACRYYDFPSNSDSIIGFRLVCSLP